MCLTRDSVQASHRPQGGPLKTALQVRCKKNRRMPMAPAANVAVPTWWQRATYDASGSQRNLQTSDGYGCLIRNEVEVFNGWYSIFRTQFQGPFFFNDLRTCNCQPSTRVGVRYNPHITCIVYTYIFQGSVERMRKRRDTISLNIQTTPFGTCWYVLFISCIWYIYIYIFLYIRNRTLHLRYFWGSWCDILDSIWNHGSRMKTINR